MAAKDITAERLRSVLDYDKETGLFTWKQRISTRVRIGDVAGTTDAAGYVIVTVDGARYRAHRLAWLYMYGTWPEVTIDHKNGGRGRNQADNLREASLSENQQNRALNRNNKSGFLGVSWQENAAKWKAAIGLRGKKIYLGLFDSAEQAYEAYLKAKSSLHTFQPVPRNA